ncbi:MAG: RidA family protein [Hyphomonadaceae bacterium]|nr:RidA family protein [Hyphomonadaceae bacterium]
MSSEGAIEGPHVACRGEVVVAANVAGIEAGGRAPADAQAEFDLAFANLIEVAAAEGVKPEAIGLVNVWIAERALRAHIDPAWLRCFPGPARPARKTNEAPLDGGARVLLQAYARRGAAATAIEIPEMAHRSPLPPAARLGSWIFSSVIGGENPQDKSLSADPEAQIAQAFDNVRFLMEAAGGDVRGVAHMWVFLSDMKLNGAMLESYLRMFATEGDRPARKTVPYALPAGAHIQIQIAGDVSGRRGNFEVPGVGHHDPIPMGAAAGGLLFSSGVYGIDPKTSEMVVGGVEAEIDATLANVESLMRVAGGSVADIAGLTWLVRDYALVPTLRAKMAALFGAELPALHFANYQLPSALRVQAHVVAALP